MNIKKRSVHNFTNLSMFMNNLSFLIYKDSGLSKYSVNDLKSFFIAEKYVREVLKLYAKNPDDILIHNDISQIVNFSLIHEETG